MTLHSRRVRAVCSVLWGMEVECTDFEEAGKRFLTHWGTENFGFIILGLSLAEVERMEKTEMICRGIHGRVPLVVSAYDVSGMKERAMAWGVCGFMSKTAMPVRGD